MKNKPKTKKRSKQRGGALARRRHRLVDKIAEGASMFLSGPSPTFTTLALKLAGQAAKGIRDNVNHYNKRQRGGALLTVLKTHPRSGTSLERTRGIREWVQRVSQAVTTDVRHHGKYDSITQATPFLGGYSKRSQSKQETGDVRTC